MWFQARLSCFWSIFRTLLCNKGNSWLQALLRTNAAGILEAADLKDERLLPSFNDQVDYDDHDIHDMIMIVYISH